VHLVGFHDKKKSDSCPVILSSSMFENSHLTYRKIHFSVVQQFKLDLYHPFLTFLELCFSHTQLVGLFQTSHQPVAEAATCTTQNIKKNPCPQRDSNPRTQQQSCRRR